MGFTLVEIAIVLVIIGLLLGGVLKGQELINSAKVKNLANDFRNISTFVYAYQDKYRALPGDDSAVRRPMSLAEMAATTPAAGLANGAHQRRLEQLTRTDEIYLFWQHVRLAGLATGTPAVGHLSLGDEYVPKNADGGRIGVTGDAVYTGTQPLGRQLLHLLVEHPGPFRPPDRHHHRRWQYDDRDGAGHLRKRMRLIGGLRSADARQRCAGLYGVRGQLSRPAVYESPPRTGGLFSPLQQANFRRRQPVGHAQHHHHVAGLETGFGRRAQGADAAAAHQGHRDAQRSRSSSSSDRPIR